jgi:hypothetical protein
MQSACSAAWSKSSVACLASRNIATSFRDELILARCPGEVSRYKMHGQRGPSCFFPLRVHHSNITTSGQGPRVPRLHEIHHLTGAMRHRKTSEMGLIVNAKVWGNQRDETRLMFLLGGISFTVIAAILTCAHCGYENAVTTCRHFIHDFLSRAGSDDIKSRVPHLCVQEWAGITRWSVCYL